MIASSQELEDELRAIRTACRNAIDDETGAVDISVIATQVEAVRRWTLAFENRYISDAKKRPTKEKTLLGRGMKLTQQAWHIMEILWTVEINAGEAANPFPYWATMDSGIVYAEVKAEMLTAMSQWLEDFREYRHGNTKD